MVAHKLDYFFDASPGLHALQAEVQRMTHAQRAWEASAPRELLSATRVGALRDGQLTVYACNGAVAAKLKQQSQRLLGKLQERVAEVTAIRFEVQAAPPDAGGKPHKELALSRNAVNALERLAEELEDSPLRDALQRLVGHHPP